MPKRSKNGRGKLTALATPQGLGDLAFEVWAANDTVTIWITSQWWVKLKRHLNLGEQDELDNSLLTGVQYGTIVNAAETANTTLFNLKRQRELRLALYLVDWNIPDAQGKTVRLPARTELRIPILRNLNPRFGKLLHDEIDKLVAADAELAVAQAAPPSEDEESDEDDEEFSGPLDVTAESSEATSPS